MNVQKFPKATDVSPWYGVYQHYLVTQVFAMASIPPVLQQITTLSPICSATYDLPYLAYRKPPANRREKKNVSKEHCKNAQR